MQTRLILILFCVYCFVLLQLKKELTSKNACVLIIIKLIFISPFLHARFQRLAVDIQAAGLFR